MQVFILVEEEKEVKGESRFLVSAGISPKAYPTYPTISGSSSLRGGELTEWLTQASLYRVIVLK